jgi:hypothetical protein
MKKFLILILLLIVPFALFAAYSDYYKAKELAAAAESSGDIDQAVQMFLAAEREADVIAAIPDVKLPWTLYAEWQRNNAAYLLIKKFKDQTSWENIMGKIKGIPNGPERLAVANELKELAKYNLKIVVQARDILGARTFTKAVVMAKVKSNMEFCNWVIDFCGGDK